MEPSGSDRRLTGSVAFTVGNFVPRYVWIALACYLVGNGTFEFVLSLRELIMWIGRWQ